MVDAFTVREIFKQRFGGSPRLFRAPGRVNLIGEHTDYNDGFVMPVAIDRDTVVAAAPRADSVIRIFSHNINEECSLDLNGPRVSEIGSWTSYVEGVARVLIGKGHKIGGADLVILSTDHPQYGKLSQRDLGDLPVYDGRGVLDRTKFDRFAAIGRHA